jgi:hypothetical protein
MNVRHFVFSLHEALNSILILRSFQQTGGILQNLRSRILQVWNVALCFIYFIF